jgi:antitoxin (DNA-binding transcriptional repressor) of toxin-antitoxin stability system
VADSVEKVGIREFRERAGQYLAGSEPVAITRNGQVIGFYVPVPPDRAATDLALERVASTVERIRKRTGMSEDAVADRFDLRKPLIE